MQSLEVLLQTQLERPSQEGYALALNAARTSQPTEHALAMVMALYDRDGERWLEVAVRLAANNLELVEVVCRHRYDMQRAVVCNL